MKTYATHICIAEEVKPRKKDRRGEVLEQVRTFGGFSIFWATDVLKRAREIESLEREGVIRRRMDDKRDAYPWCVYEIVAGKETERR